MSLRLAAPTPPPPRAARPETAGAARSDAARPDAVSPGPVWPASAQTLPSGELAVGGVPLAELADRFGTPAYVLDEDEVRARARAWRAALPGADVAYASKAFLCRAMVSWMDDEGLSLDVCSAGELELAAVTGFPAGRITLHGNAKSPEELRAALRLGVGRIVVDSTGEISRLAALLPATGTPRQRVLLRVVPGVEAGAHKAVRTGVEDQKFGVPITGGVAEDAIARILGQPALQLAGLHCHLGSQIAGVEPYVTAVRRLVSLLARVRDRHGVTLPELDLGGGFAIAYRDGDPAFDPRVYADRVVPELHARCAEAGLPVPRLAVEPGRWIAGPAGVALYRVLAVKTGAARTFVAVDGGMSDNPRPALYGARYTVRLAGRGSAAPPRRVTVVGRHCEAGDVLAEDVELPADVRPGDLLAVPAAGAYHLSMASSYNLVGRPPVAAVSGGRARLLVRRETLADLRARDLGL
ncbi:diaminopimelate decarboxylase [Streptomyces sp. B1866]|uniref:diaminopimelate decarboxylase n=1 Tax=Streptomyces sp. B1866 TaxID=3075431 RepID=UPI00288F97C7|nr:diaminopimelate decarboxylase [Streptomyces sp. B1866]MDT3398049.1 diaminopimelate decarboxylase [Streptomyces sp. B1866]